MDESGKADDLLKPGSKLDDFVVQSPNDKHKYRIIVLNNGLRALLIADVEADPEISTSSESGGAANENKPTASVVKPSKQNAKKTSGKRMESGSEEESSEDSDDGSELSDVEMEEDPKSPSTSAAGKKKYKRADDEDNEKLAAAALCIGVGSFSDPPEVPGLAHFLEHMVFMGSEKYPDENAFDSFIKKHGGNDNAFTDCERTCFYFDVERKHFKGALDIFAQFFINPLMKRDSVDRELKSVDAEFDMSKTSDNARKQQLLGSLARSDAPMAKFMWGNNESLKNMPTSQGVDPYEHLQKFHDRYYSSHFMTLVVQAKETLDVLETWVTDIFSPVPYNKSAHPAFGHVTNSFATRSFTKLYKVIPVKNVHQVELTWHLPCMKHLYRCKPLHYVGWLVGHEGAGSILSYLRTKLWALTIGAGNGESGWEHNSTGAIFTVNLTLTDSGLAHVFEVMTVIFEYMAMLRKVGPSPAIYKELKTIEDNEFRWKEQVDPSDYVEHLAEAMQIYHPKDYLRGDSVVYDYDNKAKRSIEDILQHMVPNNCNVMFLSRNYDQPAVEFKEEFWYKTKYTCSELPAEYVEKWKHLSPRSELRLPTSNEYIATDFSLKTVNPLLAKEPKLILNTERSRLWFKQDKKFKVPRGYIFMEILSPVVSSSARSQALFDLFVDVLSHNLQEIAYNAHVAQLEYEFKMTTNGLTIKINGFSHKLPKLFETIVDHIADFDVSEELFHTMNEQLKKKYYNSFIKPDKLARDIRLMILEDRAWTKVHRRHFLLDLKRADLIGFVSEFRSMHFIEGYVQGNFVMEEALQLEEYIRSRLNSNVLPVAMHPVERVVELPSEDCTIRVKSFHEEDANSCVVNYYQVGPVNIQGFVTNELLNMMMDEPCFDILRTREQLGYSVYSAAKNTSGVIGLVVAVSSQASKFSVRVVNDKIEQFLVEIRERLDICKDEEFDCQKKSLIAIKQCDDSHMGEEADRLWAEIRDKTYLFDRLDKEIDQLENLTLDDIRLWFLNTLDKNEANLRKKLSVQIVGYGDTETDTPVVSEVFSTLSHSNTVDTSQCQDIPQEGASTTKMCEANSKTDSAADTGTVFDFQYLTTDDSSTVDSSRSINNLSQFKHRLPLYPVSKIL